MKNKIKYIVGVSIAIIASLLIYFIGFPKSPEKMFKHATDKAYKKNTGKLLEAYKNYSDILDEFSCSESKSTVKIEKGEGLDAYLQENGVDVSWMKALTFENTALMSDDKASYGVNLLLNDVGLISLNAIMDSENLYFNVPEFTDKYAYIGMDEDASDIIKAVNPSTQIEKFKSLPDADLMKKVMDRYHDIIMSEIPKTEKTKETITAEDISLDSVKLTATYDAESINKIVKNIAEAAKTDDELKEVLSKFYELNTNPLNDDFEYFYNEMIDGLLDYKYDGDAIRFTIWIDRYGNIVGKSFENEKGEKLYEIKIPYKNKEYALISRFYNEGAVISEIKGKGNIKDEKLSGDFRVSIFDLNEGESEQSAILISISDMDLKKLEKLELSSHMDISFVQNSDIENISMFDINSLSLSMDIDSEYKKDLAHSKFNMNLKYEGEDFITLSSEGESKKTDKEVIIPENAISMEDPELEKEVEGNMDKFMDHLRESDIPDEYIDSIPYMLN